MNADRYSYPPQRTDNLFDATIQVFEAGQMVVVDRIEVLRAELREDAVELVLVVGMAVASGVVVTAGYCLLLASLVGLLSMWTGSIAALAIIGAVHLVIGLAVGRVAIAKLRDAPYLLMTPNDTGPSDA